MSKLTFKKTTAALCSLLLMVTCLNACEKDKQEEVENLAMEFANAIYEGNDSFVINNLIYDEKPGLPGGFEGKIKDYVIHNRYKTEKKGGVKKIKLEEVIFTEDELSALVELRVYFNVQATPDEEKIYMTRKKRGQWKVILK